MTSEIVDHVLHLSTRNGIPGELRFQLLSDVHLEFGNQPHIESVAPVLLLCGDIGYARDDDEGEKLVSFVRSVSKKFELILYLAGNHEYWGTSFEKGNQWLAKNLEGSFENVFLMHRRRLYINNVCVLGATLWTNTRVRKSHGTFSQLSQSHRLFWQMSDFDQIEDLRHNHNKKWPDLNDARKWDCKEQTELERCINKALFCYQSWFENDVDWLNEELENAQERNDTILVLTHHAPTGKGSVFPGDENSEGRTHTELLSNLLNPAVRMWAFGHTHWNCEIDWNGALIVSNALGYPSDADGRIQSCQDYKACEFQKVFTVIADNRKESFF